MIYDDYVYILSAAEPQSTLCTLTLPMSLILPKDLEWIDELTYSPVSQSVEYGTTGALLIQEGVKQKGRPITLGSSDSMAWVTRQQGDTLKSMMYSPGLVMQLKFCDFNNQTSSLFSYNVMFRHSEGALDIKNIKDFDQYESSAWYIIKAIRLMETLTFEEQQ